jgi:hypothetical protein
MKAVRFLPVLILVIIVSGCHSVTSKYLVGEKPYVIDKPEEWAGEWVGCPGNETISIKVVDEHKGILRVTSEETGSSGEKDRTSLDVYLWEAGAGKAGQRWIFANVAFEEEPYFYLVRVKNMEGCQIIFWKPDPEKFKPLVEKKVIPGEVVEDRGWGSNGEVRGYDVHLGVLKPEDLEIIMSDKEGPALFRWDEPGVLIRRSKSPNQ